MGYWFENMLYYELLREYLGFNDLGMLNTGKVGTPEDDLENILALKTVPWGTNVIYQNNNDEGVTYFMVERKVKVNHTKGYKLKNNFITMLFTNYPITLPEDTS